MREPLGVVLLAYGGPEREEEVEPFLARIMAPRCPSSEAVDRARARYQAIGGSSPLPANTRMQARALSRWLVENGRGACEVGVGFKASDPDVSGAVGRLASKGVSRVHGVIMASHRSDRATGDYEEALARAAGEHGVSSCIAPEWHLEPGYVEAVAARVLEAGRTAVLREDVPLVFSAHSLPLVDGAPDAVYASALEETAAAVAERLGRRTWRLAYQSASPRPGVVWMGPDVTDVLLEVSDGGGEVVVVPLGFVCEHLETLYDLDIALEEVARSAGITMRRARTVGEHPRFIDVLGKTVLRSVAAWNGRSSSNGEPS